MPQETRKTVAEARHDRPVQLRANTFNEADRSVEVCWTTGASVKRYSWDEGYYMEELAVDKKSIRLDRFNAMALLDTHEAGSMEARLGTVVPGSVRIEGGKAYARIKFSKKQRAEELMQDVRDGHPLPISVGYKIHQYQKTEGADGQLPVLRAIDWEPLELSAVPIPADSGATSRSEEEHEMPQTLEQERQDENINRKMTVREARGFALELTRGVGATSDVSDELDSLIKRNMTEAQIRDELLGIMAARQNRTPTFPHAETSENRHGGLTRNAAIADALQHRVNPTHAPSDGAREFVGLSLVEVARKVLEANGVSTRGMARGEVAERAMHTTSDFPIILGQLGNTVMQAAYRGEPSGLKAAARRTTISDFRAKRSINMSDWPALKKVNEHGEFPRGTISESAESYKLNTFGTIVAFSRQLLINDSLGAFVEPAQKFGRMAAVLEAEILAGLLISNPKMMSDGKTLFHADHGNIGAAAALAVDSVSTARTSMRKQKDLAGRPAGLRAKYLVVGPDLETQGEKILTQIAATKSIDVNALPSQLELIVDDRLVDPTGWYLAAAPNSGGGLEYAYLEGAEGPEFFERPGFNIDGVEYKVRLDFGAGFVDWRGWSRNVGA